jgi:hypothetical protein
MYRKGAVGDRPHLALMPSRCRVSLLRPSQCKRCYRQQRQYQSQQDRQHSLRILFSFACPLQFVVSLLFTAKQQTSFEIRM